MHCSSVMRMAFGGQTGYRGLQVHFRSFPVGQLLRWEGEASLRAAFFNSLKARGPTICTKVPSASNRQPAGSRWSTLQEMIWSARPSLQPPEAGLIPRALMCGPALWLVMGSTHRTNGTDARRHGHFENTILTLQEGSKHMPGRARRRGGHGDLGGERAVGGGGVQ